MTPVIDVGDPAREARLAAALKGCCIGGAVHAFASVGSTMDIAHRLAREDVAEGALVWAARQEQGRGRQGRAWLSPEGGAYFSMLLRPTRPAAEWPQLSLVAGLAVAEAVRELTGLHPSIRWPNDLMLDGKKVCGILVEAGDRAAIVGIGINVTTDAAALPDTATSLAQAGADCEPERLTAAVCGHVDRWYDRWTALGLAPIRESLRPLMGLFGQPVHLTAGAERVEGVASDLDESGRLVVRLDSGILRAFDMGEVTLLRKRA